MVANEPDTTDDKRILNADDFDFNQLTASGELREIGDYSGDGFSLEKDKDSLIGTPFVVVDFQFTEGDWGQFVYAKIVTSNNDKLVINDGSTGIRDQLISYFDKTGLTNGVFCPRGLRRSDYKYEDSDGKAKPAVTYYLDTAKTRN